MLASEVINRARDVLQDAAGTRWTDAEMLRWLSSAQRALATVRPSAMADTSGVALATGTKQVLPPGAFLLLDVSHNLGSDGATVGPPIRKVDLDSLKAFTTTWASADDGVVVKNYAYDPERDPLSFYVYPRVPATPAVYIEIVYAKTPAELAATTDILAAPDEYESPLTDYVLFRAFLKESESVDFNRATGFYNSFATALGLKLKRQQELVPESRVMNHGN